MGPLGPLGPIPDPDGGREARPGPSPAGPGPARPEIPAPGRARPARAGSEAKSKPKLVQKVEMRNQKIHIFH